MNTPEDPIDALLREPHHYLADDGFTTRVLRNLPRRQRRSLRPLVMLGSVALGSMLMLRWLPAEQLPPLTLSVLFSPDFKILLPWAVVLLVTAVLAMGAFSAVREED